MSDLRRIEDSVARDRDALNQTLSVLTDALEPRRVAHELKTQMESYGGELGQQAWSTAKRNPAALALVGAGIALAISGTGARAKTDAPARPKTKADLSFEERVARADKQMQEETYPMTGRAISAAKMHSALEQGLDGLPPAARKRVVAARKAAIGMQHKIETQAKKATKAASSFANQQPLATGALAFGFGALVAAMLPGTRREDEALGAQRDALLSKAHGVLRDEMAKVNDKVAQKIDDAADASPASRAS